MPPWVPCPPQSPRRCMADTGLVGVVAEASGLELDFDFYKDDLPGANHEWLEYILERFEMGREANEG